MDKAIDTSEQEPRVAIIIPCYNSGSTLLESIDSALAQDYNNLEVVLVDDGSDEPSTLAVIDEISKREDVVVLRQTNQGPSAARNHGIRHSKPEFFLPLDADDLIHTSYVRKAVHKMQSDDGLGIVYCEARLFGTIEAHWDLPEFSWDRILFENLIFCTALFRFSDWENSGGYDEELRVGIEDYDFILRILSLGRSVHRIDEELFYYRRSDNTRNTEFIRRRENLVNAQGRIFRNNLELYSEHAESIFSTYYAQVKEINDLNNRYRILELIRNRNPRFFAAFRRTREFFRSFGGR